MEDGRELAGDPGTLPSTQRRPSDHQVPWRWSQRSSWASPRECSGHLRRGGRSASNPTLTPQTGLVFLRLAGRLLLRR
jgi:hypothetical protein